MKKVIFTAILCALLVPHPLFAAEKKKPELTVSEQECRALVEYQPSPDTEYKPGIDVHGKPVMEADLTPTVVKPPEKISFDITVDLAQYMGMKVPAGLESKARMGTITVEKGQVKFNGNPLEGDAVAALKALCAEQNAKKTAK